jgi:hypothetical protein
MTSSGHSLRQELTEFRNEQRIHGIDIVVRCFIIARDSRARYEIHVQGRGQTAIVDVTTVADIAPMIERSTAAFAESARLRLQATSS